MSPTSGARAALADAGVSGDEVDMLVCATMTPDRQNPGIAGAVQHKAGLGDAATFDLRQQCAGFLFGLDLADMLISTGRAGTVVVVGVEVHAGYLPWGDAWQIVLGQTGRAPTAGERELATRHRTWSVLFGDGAGAAALREQTAAAAAPPAPAVGILKSVLRTDGAHGDLIEVPGLGSQQRPYADAAQIAAGLHHPAMNGAGLYRLAVETMPAAVCEALEAAGCELDDLDLVVAHQANGRILDGARRRLGVDAAVMPSQHRALGQHHRGPRCRSCTTNCASRAGSLRGRWWRSPASVRAPTGGAVLYREPGATQAA